MLVTYPLATLLLGVLALTAGGPIHAGAVLWGSLYGISQAIRMNSGDVLQVDTGSLYPALHRLEKQKWIASAWKFSENKQRVKIYRLTAAGKKQLSAERSRWSQLLQAMSGILEPRGKESEI